jgi:hypothetical protein
MTVNNGHDTRAIQAFLGHRNIQNTTRYTALAPQRFKAFFSGLNEPLTICPEHSHREFSKARFLGELLLDDG